MLKPNSIFYPLGLLAGAAFLHFSSLASIAQTSAADLQPWQGGGQTDAASSLNNPLGERNGVGASSLFDLMNRIQMLQGQSSAEFARNQEKKFNTAVEDFQKKQQEALNPSDTPSATP